MDTNLTESDIRALATDATKLAIYELASHETQLGTYTIFLGDGARMEDLPEMVQRMEGCAVVRRGDTVVCLKTARFLDRPAPGLLSHVLRKHKVVELAAVFENDGNEVFAAAFREAFAMVKEYEEARLTLSLDSEASEEAVPESPETPEK